MICTTGVLKEKAGEIWIWTKIKGKWCEIGVLDG